MILPGGMLPLAITVRPAAWAGDESQDDFIVLEIDDPGGLDEGQLRENLIAMTGLTDRYLLDERRSTTEWGASGSGYDVFLTVASDAWSGIVGGAAWALLQGTFVKLRGRGAHANRPPTDEEVQERARYRIATRYSGIEAADLVVVRTATATSRDGYSSTVTLHAPTGEQYIVTASSTDEYSMTRVERSTDFDR